MVSIAFQRAHSAVHRDRARSSGPAHPHSLGGRRDLQLAVHGEPHQGAGGLRLRLDARRRGPGRRPGQARHRRRESEVEDLRQGRLDRLGGRARRGPPHGLHRRPPPPVGRRAREQQDPCLRRGHQPREAKAHEDHHEPRRQIRMARAAHFLRAAGPHAGRQPVQREGSRRRHRYGGLQQQGRLRGELRDAHRQTAATDTATTWPSTRRATPC